MPIRVRITFGAPLDDRRELHTAVHAILVIFLDGLAALLAHKAATIHNRCEKSTRIWDGLKWPAA